MFLKIRIAAALFFIVLFLYSCTGITENGNMGPEALTGQDVDPPASDPVFLFGIPADSFDISSGQIKRNGFLSSILSGYGVPLQETDQVIRNYSDIFDARRIKAGNTYTVFRDRDTTGRARYFVYEHNPSTCYIFSFNDSLNITPYHRSVSRTLKYASGTIDYSLWETVLADGLHPSLVNELSEIYAWTVDFFGLQKGDSFKVIYDELSVDGNSLGAGRIYGAEFTWAGKTIKAIPFVQDSIESFYDEDGNSLRKAFLKAPLRFSRISSRFSSSRLHPILRIRRPHHGVDYAAPAGTPVLAIGDGKVVKAGYDGGSGRMVRINHNSVYSTAYLHLSRFGPGIAAGAWVKQGDIIGYVGSSGLSTGPHLDFRFYKNGSPVDPLKVEAPSVEPVSEENKYRFMISRDVVISLLDTF